MTKKKLLIGTVPFLLALALVSCKDRYVQPDFTKVPPIIELPVASLAGDGSGNSMNFGLTIGPSVDSYIYVNYAAPNPNTSDVTVTMAVDDAVLKKYNSVRDSDNQISPLPAGSFTAPTKITIPAGAGKVQYHVKFNTTLFDPAKTYGLPLKIVDGGGNTVSGNYGTLVMVVNAKNIYDGTYTMKGTITRNSATGQDTNLGGVIKSGVTTQLATLSATANSFGQYWRDGSGVGGIDGLRLSVDPTTNKVTVSSTGNATLKNTPGYNSHYDPATKTFYLAFDWGTAPSTRLAVDTLVYSGSR